MQAVLTSLPHVSLSGGVIEAAPKHTLGSPSVNVFIAPTGAVTVTSCHEQLFAAPFVFGGCVSPQTSVPHAALAGAATATGQALYNNGYFGYFGIDFVALWDEQAQCHRLWAVDLNLRVTASCLAHKLFHFIARGSVHPATGQYYLPPTQQPAARTVPTQQQTPSSKCCHLIRGVQLLTRAARCRPPHNKCNEQLEHRSNICADCTEFGRPIATKHEWGPFLAPVHRCNGTYSSHRRHIS